MKQGQIRSIVICVFTKNNTILVCEGFDEVKQEYYYRPIGGGIDFGETSKEALIREVQEEINAKIEHVKYLGTIENIFTYNGMLGLEMVTVYDAVFIDETFYEKPVFFGQEDNGETFKLLWKPISDFEAGKLRLVPENLLRLL